MSIENALAWLEETALAEWVASSAWGYAITLSAHAVGMAVIVGITVITAARILGFPKGLPLAALRRLYPTFLIGLALNVISGVALFVAAASELFYNIAFQSKIIMVILGIIIMLKIDQKILRPAALNAKNAPNNGTADQLDAKSSFYAISAIAIWWFSVVLSGRLIGYVIYM